MKVGINGMGRIGRLALRAALGGIRRPDSDPRAGNRLEVAHVNELKGGIAATAHLLEFDSIHGRWHAPLAVNSDNATTIGKDRIGFSAELAGGVGEGIAVRIDGNAADQCFLVDEAMLVLVFNSLEYTQCLGHHLGADAIAGQYADQGFHARSLSKRVMASD